MEVEKTESSPAEKPLVSAEGQVPEAAKELPKDAPGPKGQKEPEWLASRLERERNSTLSQLGFKNVDEAKAAFDELKTRRDKEKTEAEKMAAENADLKAKLERLSELGKIVESHTQAALSQLTPQQQEVVLSVAGNDAAKVVETIERLRSAGMLTPPSPPPRPAAAPSAPSPQAPLEQSPGAPSRLREYENLRASNPALAAIFRHANASEIYAEQKRRS